MANRHSDPIRNLVLPGHADSGKSTLEEALLQREGNMPLQERQGRGESHHRFHPAGVGGWALSGNSAFSPQPPPGPH